MEYNINSLIKQGILKREGFQFNLDCNIMKEQELDFYEQFIKEPELNLLSLKSSLQSLFNIDINKLKLKLPNFDNFLNISSIRIKHIDQMFTLTGVIKRLTKIVPRVKIIKYDCLSCGTTISVLQDAKKKKLPKKCSCGNSKLFNIQSEETENIQELNLEESHEDVEDKQPQQIRIYLEGNLTEDSFTKKLQPGRKISIIGIIKKLPIFMTKADTDENISEFMVEAKDIKLLDEDFEIKLSEDDIEQIKEIACDNPLGKLSSSLVPEIYGNQEVKEAIVLQLVKGVRKERADGSYSRADIHILLSGDPGCYSKDTLIIKENGEITSFEEISKIFNNKIGVYNIKLNLQRSGISELADKFHIYPPTKIIKIVLKSGKFIKATYNNPFYTKKGWVKAEELKIGDKLKVINKIDSSISDYAKIDLKIQKFRKLKLYPTIPKQCNEHLAFIIGFLLAEGWGEWKDSGTKRLSFALPFKEKEIFVKICEYFEEIFDLKLRKSIKRRKEEDNRKDLLQARTSSVLITSFFKGVLFDKKIPEYIFKSPDSVVASLLTSLFEGDGTVYVNNIRNKRISLKSVNRDLISKVQILLLRFGIKSNIFIEKSKNPNWRDIYLLTIGTSEDIEKFYHHINFFSSTKRKKLKQLVLKLRGKRRRKKNDFEEIIHLQEMDPEQVYDFEVPSSKTIIVNGIYGHNTSKSVTLTSVTKKTPKAKMIVGTKTSRVGLGAMVVKDELLGTWGLEVGSLVLANESILCMHPDSNIWTDDGVMNIKEIWEKGIQNKDNSKRRFLKYIPSYNFFTKKLTNELLYEIIKNPYKGKLIKLKLANGLFLSVTPNHKFYASGICTRQPNFKERPKKIVLAKDLKKGNYLNNFEIPFPENLIKEDRAYLFGFIYGDGFIDKGGITISQSSTNQYLIDKILKEYPKAKLYKKTPVTRLLTSRNGKTYKLIAKDNFIFFNDRKLTIEYFNKHSNLEDLLKLDKESLCKFLAGIFDADGSINHCKDKVLKLRITTTNDEKQNQTLMLALKRLGINSIKQKRRQGITEISVSLGKDIKTFWETIGTYSAKLLREKPPKIMYKTKYYGLRDKYIRILEIEEFDYEGDVFDINVMHNHNFIVNGILSHNCIDELDKMYKENLSELLEPMSGGTITINKAGISAKLPANTCMPKGTPIECLEGIKSIGSIEKGEIIWGMDKTFKIIPSKVLRIYKHPLKKKLLELETNSGRVLKLTGNHEVLTLIDGEVKWIQSSKLRKGNEIASIRRLPILKKKDFDIFNGKSIKIPTVQCNICGYEWNYKGKRKKPTCPKCAIGVSVTNTKKFKVYLKDRLSSNGREKGIYFNGKITEDLAYICGLIFSDGHIRTEPTGSISFFNNNILLLKKFEDVVKKLGLHISKIIKKDNKNKTYTIHGDVVISLIKNITKKMPILSNNLINCFICGVIDGDGSVRKGRFQIFTAIKEDTDFIRMLLLKLGIKSNTKLLKSGKRYCIDHFVNAKDFYYLEVNGIENCKKLNNRILSKHKRDNLNLTQNLKYNGGQRTDFINVKDRFRKFRKEINLTKKELGTNLSNKERKLTRKALQNYLKEIKKLKSANNNYLDKLAYSDLLWDKIKQINIVQDDFVYDLQTTTENFIAEGVVVHNSILASANPMYGNFNLEQPLAKQLDLPSPILNRFDLIFILLDKPELAFDSESVNHVFESYLEKKEAEVPIELFKKYIFYCRKQKPKLKRELIEDFKKFYVGLRQNSNKGGEHGLPINLRNMEGLVRLSEANAKLRLSDTVEKEDFEVAKNIFMYCLKQVGMDNETGLVDTSRVTERIPVSKRKKLELFMQMLEDMSQVSKELEYSKISDKSKELNLTNWELQTFISELKRENHILEPKRGTYVLI